MGTLSYAADTKTSDLDAIVAPATSDYLYIVNDDDTSSKKITVGNLLVDGLIPDTITVSNYVLTSTLNAYTGSVGIDTIGTISAGDVSAIETDPIWTAASGDYATVANLNAYTGSVGIDTLGTVTTGDVSAIEDDPQVGAVDLNLWCVGDGSAVQCSEAAPAGGGSLDDAYANGATISVDVSRVEIDDAGASDLMLLKLTQDNVAMRGLIIGNDTYSTNDTFGLALWQSDSGVGRISDASNFGDAFGISVTTAGRVGIGKTAPAVMLDVNGSATVSGTIVSGVEDTTRGFLYAHGGAAGDTYGGGLFLFNSDDYDETIDHYDIISTLHKLYIGPDTNIDALTLTGDDLTVTAGTFTVSVGRVDFGGATSTEISNSAAPTVDATGEIALDTNIVSASQGGIVAYDGAQVIYVVATKDTPGADEVPKFDGSYIYWAADATGGTTT